MVLSFSFASADKCASWSNYQLNYLPQWAEILTQRSNLTPPQASEKYFDLHVVPKLQSWFASYLSYLFPRDQQTRVGMQFTPNRSIFTWLFTISECTEKISMKEDLINILAKLRSRKNVDMIFVFVTSIEGTPLFRGKGHFFWVPKPRFNHTLALTTKNRR